MLGPGLGFVIGSSFLKIFTNIEQVIQLDSFFGFLQPALDRYWWDRSNLPMQMTAVLLEVKPAGHRESSDMAAFLSLE